MSNYRNNKQVMEAGRRAIREVARREGISETEVRAEMAFSIREAYGLNNPMWANSPFTDGVPTPEEFIVWTADLVKKQVLSLKLNIVSVNIPRIRIIE